MTTYSTKQMVVLALALLGVLIFGTLALINAFNQPAKPVVVEFTHTPVHLTGEDIGEICATVAAAYEVHSVAFVMAHKGEGRLSRSTTEPDHTYCVYYEAPLVEPARTVRINVMVDQHQRGHTTMKIYPPLARRY